MGRFRIQEVRVAFEDFAYRAPMKFRGTVVDRVTLLNVSIKCESNGGTVEGFGSMPLGNVWAFPSARLKYAETLAAMKLRSLLVTRGRDGVARPGLRWPP